jgi:hypothetical protein
MTRTGIAAAAIPKINQARRGLLVLMLLPPAVTVSIGVLQRGIS